MKSRNGFVSNSSSSSFLIGFRTDCKIDLEVLMAKVFKLPHPAIRSEAWREIFPWNRSRSRNLLSHEICNTIEKYIGPSLPPDGAFAKIEWDSTERTTERLKDKICFPKYYWYEGDIDDHHVMSEAEELIFWASEYVDDDIVFISFGRDG